MELCVNYISFRHEEVKEARAVDSLYELMGDCRHRNLDKKVKDATKINLALIVDYDT